MNTLLAVVGSWLALSLLMWMSLGFSWPGVLSCGLTVSVLYVAATATDARGWPLFRLLALLYGGIGVVNIQIEVLAFRMSSPAEVARVTASGLAEAIGVSAALAWAITRDAPARADEAHRLPRRLWLRVPLLALAYVVLYLVAGSLIYPLVKHYYAANSVVTIPHFGVILGTQLVRGLVYAAALLPLLRQMEGRRLHAGFVGGLALSVFGGIGPLLLPLDDVFPPEVRAVHMLEILGSNFLLGLIAAVLLVRRGPGAAPERAMAAA